MRASHDTEQLSGFILFREAVGLSRPDLVQVPRQLPGPTSTLYRAPGISVWLLMGALKLDKLVEAKKHEPALTSLHRLPVRYSIDFKILLFVSKPLNGLFIWALRSADLMVLDELWNASPRPLAEQSPSVGSFIRFISLFLLFSYWSFYCETLLLAIDFLCAKFVVDQQRADSGFYLPPTSGSAGCMSEHVQSIQVQELPTRHKPWWNSGQESETRSCLDDLKLVAFLIGLNRMFGFRVSVSPGNQ